MNNEDDLQHRLLSKIKTRRESINVFVRNLDRRAVRLTNLSIICSALTSALTAAPAFGGVNFIEGMQQLGMSGDPPVWRVVCFLALFLSLVAAISTNMYKSHDMAARIAKAQASSVLLEGLETAVEFGQFSVQEAMKLYTQYIADIPFIQEVDSEPVKG